MIEMIICTKDGKDTEYTKMDDVPFKSLENYLGFAGTRVKDGLYDFHKIPIDTIVTVSLFFKEDKKDV